MPDFLSSSQPVLRLTSAGIIYDFKFGAYSSHFIFHYCYYYHPPEQKKNKEVYLLLPRFNQQSTNGSTLSEMERKCSSSCNRRRTRVVPVGRTRICVYIFGIFFIFSPELRFETDAEATLFATRPSWELFFCPLQALHHFPASRTQMMMVMVRRTCWMEFPPNCALPGSVERDEMRTRWNGTESLFCRRGAGQGSSGDGKRYAKNPQSLTGLMGWTTGEYHNGRERLFRGCKWLSTLPCRPLAADF